MPLILHMRHPPLSTVKAGRRHLDKMKRVLNKDATLRVSAKIVNY
jgi:hypothetical protein